MGGNLFNTEMLDQQMVLLNTRISKEALVERGWTLIPVSIPQVNDVKNRFAFEKDNLLMVLDDRSPIPHVEIFFKDPSKVNWLPAPELFRCIIPCVNMGEFVLIERLLHLKDNITAKQAGIGESHAWYGRYTNDNNPSGNIINPSTEK